LPNHISVRDVVRSLVWSELVRGFSRLGEPTESLGLIRSKRPDVRKATIPSDRAVAGPDKVVAFVVVDDVLDFPLAAERARHNEVLLVVFIVLDPLDLQRGCHDVDSRVIAVGLTTIGDV
jgi:hypothetical protein